MAVIGQLVQVNFKEPVDGSSWEYGIIVASYDSMYLVQKQSGGRTMQHVSTATEGVAETSVDNDSVIIPLFIDGKPVLAKKSIFGKYKYPKYRY